MRKLFIICLLFCICTLTYAQQAWTKEKGKFFSQVGISTLAFNSIIDNDLGKFRPINRDITDITIGLYGEYGLFDGLTLSGQIPFKSVSSANGNVTEAQNGSLSGLSNINLGLTARLYQNGGAVVSGKMRTNLPTATYDVATGLRTGFDATSFIPSVLFGLGADKFFLSGELGYEIRNNGYANRTLAGFQIGKFFINRKLLAIFNFDLAYTLEGGTYDDAKSEFTGLYLSDQTYLSPGVKLGYYFTPKVALWGSIGVGLPPTNNVGASPGFSLSFSYSN
jgi:hypothetical protein